MMTIESLRQFTGPDRKEHPLSLFQERLWLLNQKNRKDLSYNIPVAFLIEGALNVSALEKSLNEIIARHETLRTRFVVNSRGEPTQVVDDESTVDLSPITVEESEVQRLARAHAQHNFDLSCGPLLVARLLALPSHRHLLLLNVHHIVADGWSIEGILFAELQAGYKAFCSDSRPILAPLPISYVDFSHWQRKQDLAQSLEYWQESLAGYEDSLEVPADFTRKSQSGLKSQTITHQYDSAFSNRLDQFAQSHGCTLFMALLAGLGVVVSRYTGKQDFCIGTTASGRNQPELEGLIGFFINILPLRIKSDENLTVGEYMRGVRRLTLAGFDHQHVPFERIIYSLGLDRSGKDNPLVPVVLRHQNFPHTSLEGDLPGAVRFKPYAQDDDDLGTDSLGGPESAQSKRALARCELELSYTGDRNDLKVKVMYASDLYRKETVERLLGHLEHVLNAMFADANGSVSDLPLMSDGEIRSLLSRVNCAQEIPLPAELFPERFDQAAAQTPGAIACYDRVGEWTYEAIASHVNRLANALVAQGIGAGDVVGVCLERGAQLLISLLAIWKTGAGYVALDPGYPETYLQQILVNATPKRTICSRENQVKLALRDSECCVLGANFEFSSAYSDVAPMVRCDVESLAYLMYTSGSTGVPKGVRVPHRQLVNWLSGLERLMPFEAGEIIAQKTTIAFAVSVKELFAGLLNGCAQVFIDGGTVQDVRAFTAVLAKYRVTRLNLVPSHLSALLSYLQTESATLPALKHCIAAGEPLTADLVSAFRRLLPNARLYNNYGCTELNDICYYDTSAFTSEEGFVPVGKAIQNTQTYVLDRLGRMVPEGVPGELHVASAAMPDGYHKLDALTEERFHKNRFSLDPKSILFNTGDVVRYLPDGCLEFIGRWDFQVKVRGYRIDVRQVEQVMGQFPSVGVRAVVGHGNQLIAYYVATEETPLDIGALREFLRARLPVHLVPSAFVAVSAMPRLPNGKLDRRALTPSLGKVQRSDAYEPPVTEVERSLAAIWSEVLEVPEDEIGRHTDFFEIGGHSLSATRVVARIRERAKLEIGLSVLFEHPRLSAMAEYMQGVLSANRLTDDTVDSWPSGAKSSGSSRSRMPGLLENKVALVTGSSRGIGSATVRLLANQGAAVAINYMHSEVRARNVKDVIEQDGGTAEVFQADVTDAEQATELVRRVREKFGRIDVLVANAAIGFTMESFAKYQWEDFSRKVLGELKSLFCLCQAVLPEMLERKNGSIVVVSSTMSKTASEGFIAHSTAKAALDSFVRSMAFELGPDGIRVNTVAPGLTLTDATANLSPQRKDAAAARCPMRRNGLPRDVAGAVLFLASDLSQFMTGSYLPVDGGFTML